MSPDNNKILTPPPRQSKLDFLTSPWAAMVHDLLMVPVAWLTAYWLRFNLGVIPEHFLSGALNLLPLVLVAQGSMFAYFGLYRGVWRFASLPDLLRIVKAVAAGTAIVAVVTFLLTRLELVPRTVLLFFPLLLIFLLGAPRLIYRMFKDRYLSTTMDQKVLVVGAGAAGEMLVRDLLRNSPRTYQPVAFIDDNPFKHGREIRGIRVIGNTDIIPDAVRKWGVDLILLALPSATTHQMQRIVSICEQAGVPFRTLPMMQDLVSGNVSSRELREVEIGDLLGREPIMLDWDALYDNLSGKSILVTGGGGSIGSELCRQIARLRPDCLVLLENSEFNLYQVDMNLRREFPELNLHPCLGDVTDVVRVEKIMEDFKPQVIFHAAAYKHVPLLESQVREAVRNNILGTKQMALAADKYGCETFVQVSTDKAVNPSNVMGSCKRVAEIFCQAINERSETRYITVRFGNVLGSAGSVVPLFKKQIAEGGPVTVTDPDVTRYFMTISEASQLIMQAGVMGRGGEIYVLDMGEPIKIAYLAEQMIRLSGRKLGEDIEIVYTGLRPGEKLFEELFHKEENLKDTVHSKILLARSRQVDWECINRDIERMGECVHSYDVEGLESLLLQLVPEHSCSNGEPTYPQLIVQADSVA